MSQSKTTLDYCKHCGQRQNLEIVAELYKDVDWTPYGMTFNEIKEEDSFPSSSFKWSLLFCPECKQISVIQNEAYSEYFEIEYDHNGEIVGGNANWETQILYPRYRQFKNMPHEVQEAYEDALKDLPTNAKSFGTKVGIALEYALVNMGATPGKPLGFMIRELNLSEDTKNTLELIRDIRNHCSHANPEEFTRKDAQDLRQLFEALIEQLYEVPDLHTSLSKYKKG